MHLPDKGAEKTEIVVRGRAEGRAVHGRMHVRDVGADGQGNRDRDARFVSGDENAESSKLCVENAAREELAGRFAVAHADAIGELGDFVEILAGFLGHAEPASAEPGFDIFRSVAGESDFEIVNERGAVHGDRGDEAAFDEIDQDRAETYFDDVAADAPEDRCALPAGAMDGGEKTAKIFRGEDVREGIEKFGD